MASKTVPCHRCGECFTYEPLLLFGKETFPRLYCEACNIAQEDEAKAASMDAARAAREALWEAVCPELYRDTDPARLHPVCGAAAAGWTVGRRGLGLLGESGAGKTRALFLALRKAFDIGKSCESISHNRFTKLVQRAFAGEGAERKDAVERMDRLQSVAVLLVDDVGKPPSTERADAELEELLEHRAAHCLPVLWSANGSALWLEKRFGDDRGPALVRRLCEFSETITIK